MGGHRARVGVMAWSSHLLSSGSRDRNILQRDIRAPEDFQSKLLGHRSEVRAPYAPLVWGAALHSMTASPGCHAVVSRATQGNGDGMQLLSAALLVADCLSMLAVLPDTLLMLLLYMRRCAGSSGLRTIAR